jgi:predicted ATP-grasp superfamily ATP-dependent carboligase
LSLGGHEVEVCDPDPHCLGRFSRLVSRFHRCPGLGADPAGYLAFVLDLIATGRFDVLLPIHEQGLLFAKARGLLDPYVAVALPSFDSYARVLDKAEFSRLLRELGLPQPETRVADHRREILELDRFPIVLKAAVGTASRGTWIVRSDRDLQNAVRELDACGSFTEAVLIQELVSGAIEHAQAVFCHGEIAGFHAYRQVMRGAGGGDAIKESIQRPLVRSHVARIGAHLGWHGALTLDYIVDASGTPFYIDGNPRLVEPMGAALSGLDLASLLLQVSRGECTAAGLESRGGVRTHMAIQALLGHMLAGGTRTTLIREAWRLAAKRGPYIGSREELTPVRLDWLSALPTCVTALWLLADPRAAHYLPRKGWGTHLLNPACVRTIRHMGEQLSPISV